MANIRLINRPFKDVRGYLACIGDVGEKQLKGDEAQVKIAALEMLRKWPRTVVAGDGETILLHNEQGGTLKNRAEHLVTRRGWGSVDWKKVNTAHLVPQTLDRCGAKLFDQRENSFIYVAAYTTLIHCVVVTIKKHPPSPDGITGYLITQFPFEKGGRQDHFIVRWA